MKIRIPIDWLEPEERQADQRIRRQANSTANMIHQALLRLDPGSDQVLILESRNAVYSAFHTAKSGGMKIRVRKQPKLGWYVWRLS